MKELKQDSGGDVLETTKFKYSCMGRDVSRLSLMPSMRKYLYCSRLEHCTLDGDGAWTHSWCSKQWWARTMIWHLVMFEFHSCCVLYCSRSCDRVAHALAAYGKTQSWGWPHYRRVSGHGSEFGCWWFAKQRAMKFSKFKKNKEALLQHTRAISQTQRYEIDIRQIVSS